MGKTLQPATCDLCFADARTTLFVLHCEAAR